MYLRMVPLCYVTTQNLNYNCHLIPLNLCLPIYCWSCPLLNCRYIIFMMYSKICCMLQVTQLVGQLESLLDDHSVSQAAGQKIITIISNLMNASPAVLLASSNRFQLTYRHQHQHINTSDFSSIFKRLLLTGSYKWWTIWVLSLT